MLVRFGLVTYAVFAATLGVSADPPLAKRITQQEAEQKWADYWIESEVVVGGVRYDPLQYFGHSFVKDAKDGSHASWPLHGETVLSKHYNTVELRVTTDPMQVDYDTLRGTIPGIFRFDGDDLIWVTPREHWDHARTVFEKPLVRPTSFTSTKENGYVVRRLKRTTGLYGWQPLKPDAKK